MSWDISIIDLPSEARSVADIADDFEPAVLGRRTDLIATIKNAAPMADFSDPTWGQIVAPDFVIEVNLGNAEIVDSIMLHVRGGDAAIGVVADLLNHLGRRAIDCQTGEFFDPAAAGESLNAWRAYRDRVIGSSQEGQWPGTRQS